MGLLMAPRLRQRRIAQNSASYRKRRRLARAWGSERGLRVVLSRKSKRMPPPRKRYHYHLSCKNFVCGMRNLLASKARPYAFSGRRPSKIVLFHAFSTAFERCYRLLLKLSQLRVVPLKCCSRLSRIKRQNRKWRAFRIWPSPLRIRIEDNCMDPHATHRGPRHVELSPSQAHAHVRY